jgi:hypothetical protein
MSILAVLATSAFASSHREAPAISLDPGADLTDFYAFVSPEDSTKVVFIMNVIPLEPPGGGPNFHRFDDSVSYTVRCDNEGDAVADLSWTFDFTTTYNYPNEFLYNLGAIDTEANLNITQTYTVTQKADGVETVLVSSANPGKVAPANVGVASDPNGGYTPDAGLPGAITTSYIKNQGNYRFFAGPRQESFYVDLERTFDLLNLGVDNVNTLLGMNVHSIAMEIPVEDVTKDGAAPSALAQNEVIACWSTTQRSRMRRYDGGGAETHFGDIVQVSRLGSPLVNEVVIPIGMKDLFNQSKPRNDAQFLTYVTDPILPIYMEAVLGITNPISYDAGLGIGGREDLVLTFLTGHPDLGTMPGGYVLGGAIPGEVGKYFAAFEALRMNLTLPSGYPNGRMVGDDVTDISLSAMAGLLIPGDGDFIPDGVGSAGLYPLTEFPFLGDPWAGDDHPAAFHDLP